MKTTMHKPIVKVDPDTLQVSVTPRSPPPISTLCTPAPVSTVRNLTPSNYPGSCAEASIRESLTSLKVVVHLDELLDLIDNSEQRL
jgi:hypothetical protein